MKVLFVGDIHNHNYIFEDIGRLDEKYHFNRIILVGDYVDDWNTTNHQSLETLDRLFTIKETLGDKLTLLFGNHELSYLGHKCSGHRYELEDVMEQKLKENIDKLEFYTSVKCGRYEYICSHAGFTNGFLINDLGGNKWRETLDNMSRDKLHNLDVFAKCSYLRGGRDEFSSCLWCDRREHAYFTVQEPIIPHQIVGHTPVQTIIERDNIYFIDTHSTYQDGSEYGDKSYLIWNTNQFEIVK